MMVSTTAGGRPLKSAASRPEATHGGSIDLDVGAIWCRAPERGVPSSEECTREVLSRGKLVRETRSGWANGVRPAGPAPRPPWACTVSVRVGSLGETNTCVRPRPAVCQCVCAEGALGQREVQLVVGGLGGTRGSGGPGSVASAEMVSYEAIRAVWLQLWMPYAPGASATVSVVPHSCLWRNSGSSALLGHVPPWGVPSYSPSLTPHREKWFSAQGRACSFPCWPEAPTGWGAGAPSPWDRPTALWIGLG